MRDPLRIRRKKGLDVISDTKKSEHHRLPRTHGGQSDKYNITILTMRSHDAWHRLFNRLYATNIAKQINEWHPYHGMRVEYHRVKRPKYPDLSASRSVRDEKICDKPSPIQEEAWEYLFGKLDPPQIVHKINTQYLDPDYYFTLTTA